MKLNLVGTAEAAELLDVEPSRIARWMKRGLMPEPVARLRATPVWWRDDIKAMRSQRESLRRRRGRSIAVLANRK